MIINSQLSIAAPLQSVGEICEQVELSRFVTLITNNTREFRLVEGLPIADWHGYKKPGLLWRP